MMTDGDQLAEQASALRQARESLHAVLAAHRDWMALTELDLAGEAAPSKERMRLEQALSGVPAFVALKQVDDALAGIEAEMARVRPTEPPPAASGAAEPDFVAQLPDLDPVRPDAADAQSAAGPSVRDDAAADDLTRIRGIDAVMQARLAAHGVTRFDQIAGWWPADVRQFGDELGVGRAIVRQSWVTQAELLVRQRPPGSAPATGQASPIELPAAVAEMAPHVPAAANPPMAADAANPAFVVKDAAASAVAPDLLVETPYVTPVDVPDANKDFEPSAPIRLSEIFDVAAPTARLDVIEATFTPAPADAADAAPMRLAVPAGDPAPPASSTHPDAEGSEPASPQGANRDELAEILALIRHSSARGTPAAAQQTPKSHGLTARIEAVAEEAPAASSVAEPITLIAVPTDGARKMPALGEPERAVLASLDRLAALETAVDAMASPDAAAGAPVVPTRTTTFVPPVAGPAPEIHQVALADAEADVEIVRRPQPAPTPLVPQRAVDLQQVAPAFVGAEEANVVIVRRAAGEAAPALPFYAQKPPETQSTVRRFMSALTGPASKPPE